MDLASQLLLVAESSATMKLAKALTCLLCLLSSAAVFADNTVPVVPAMYVFGDSLMDVGNLQILLPNGAVQTPYGIDFPNKTVTGRFSNGLNFVDHLAKHLGFNMSPPAYQSVRRQLTPEIRQGQGGINYAVGASGILIGTGSPLISLSIQVIQFAATKARMSTRLDPKTLDDLLEKSLFVICAGANDFFAFLAKERSSEEIASFYRDLLSNYERHVTALYKLGARKFAVVDVAPVGCTPYKRATSKTGGCKDDENTTVKHFNILFKAQLRKLSGRLPGMKYAVGRLFNVINILMANPRAYGLTEVKSACCGTGRFNGQGHCNDTANLCKNRAEYLFWDGVHGTEATDRLVANAFYYGPTEAVDPINFKKLAEYYRTTEAAEPELITEAAEPELITEAAEPELIHLLDM